MLQWEKDSKGGRKHEAGTNPFAGGAGGGAVRHGGSGHQLSGALVPELQDGIPYYSLLQRWFGVWEGEMRTRPDFFFVFRRWLWISFAVFVENAVLWGISIWKQDR